MLPLLASLLALAAMPGWQTSADALGAHYAPVLVQEMRHQFGNAWQDWPVPFDFDGNWRMDDNWSNQERLSGQATPTVHYSVVASRQRAYITYALFYPRDWFTICLPFVCHENDLEQFTLVVQNDGSAWGAALLADVKFHTGELGYVAPDALVTLRVGKARPLSLTSDGRPLMHVAWGGHGISSCAQQDGRLGARCSALDEGAVLVPPGGDSAEENSPERSHRTYALLPLGETLWRHRSDGESTWSGRIAFVGARLGRLGKRLGESLAGSGPGGGARAPWGTKPRDGLETGERFLDPALAFGRRWRLPGGLEPLPYVAHPMLEELTQECAEQSCARVADAAPPRHEGSSPARRQ